MQGCAKSTNLLITEETNKLLQYLYFIPQIVLLKLFLLCKLFLYAYTVFVDISLV